jgi:DNA-binding IclR family transcriptional regulator
MARKNSAGPVQSLDRGLAVLQAVARASGALSLGELVRATKLERSCVFRLATTLTRQGFLTQSPRTKEYSLGAAIWELVGYMQQGNPVLAVARKYVAALSQQTEETAHVSVRQGDRAVSLEHQLSLQLTGVMTAVGRAELLYCSAVGKALILDLSEENLCELFGGRSLPARTDRTLRTVGDLYRQCQQSRSRGFAVDDEEYSVGVRCVASPVRDYRGDVVAAVGISAPADRLTKRRLAIVGQIVRHAGAQMSKDLGYIARAMAAAE